MQFDKKLKKKIFFKNYLLHRSLDGWNSDNSYFVNSSINSYYKNFKYLEIGFFKGKNSIPQSKLFPESFFFSIDTFKNNRNYKFENINITKFNKTSNNLTLFKGNINKFFNKYKENIKFDIIYVDGNHSFKDCLNDLTFCKKLLKPNGIIIIDDYMSIGWPDVTKAVDSFLTKNKFIPIISFDRKIIISRFKNLRLLNYLKRYLNIDSEIFLYKKKIKRISCKNYKFYLGYYAYIYSILKKLRLAK
jgi:hypothetical protein